jgi:serine/threonine protein kinase/Tfp pilus assembly protein PilF
MDEIAQRVQAGEPVDVEAVIRAHPEHAKPLRRLLPAVEMLAGLGQSAATGDASVTPQVEDTDPARQSLGDFRIVREVGRGGMGVVYEAVQLSLSRRVALKVLPFTGMLDPKQLQRFKNEAQAAALLQHQHIVPVHFVGCERGVHFYAMQYIDGQTLAQLIAQLRRSAEPEPIPAPAGEPPSADAPAGAADRPVPPLPLAGEPTSPYGPGPVLPGPVGPAPDTVPQAGLATERSHRTAGYFKMVARLGIQAAEALHHAHEMGVIHRDVKPGNLLVDGRGSLWVTDFGLAHMQTEASLTLSGDLVGTVRYMSPEQALANRVLIDHRTDVYSLGATLYELLTLRPAFRGNDRHELLRQIAFDEPAPPRRFNKAIPAELETVVLKALEKRPEDRYANAHELAEDLQRFLKDEPVRAKRPSLMQRARRWMRRHRALVGAAAAALLAALLVLAAGLGWVVRDRVARQRDAETKVREALEAAAPGLRHGNPYDPPLVAAVQRAEAQLSTGVVGKELQGRVQQLRQDHDMLAKLERARLKYTVMTKGGGDDYPGADQLYVLAFKGYGLDVTCLNSEEATRRLRKSAIRIQLVTALDDWTSVRNKLHPGAGSFLTALAGLADDNPWRQRLRKAERSGARRALEELATERGAQNQPPANVVLLSRALRHARRWRAAEHLLRAAQQVQPTDFLINFELALTLEDKKPPDYGDAIRFYQAALTVRPKSLGVYNNLGNALTHQGKFMEAVAAFHRAIDLAPDEPLPHYNLAVELANKGRLDEAIPEYRRASRVKEGFWRANYNLGRALARKGRLDEAITEFQEAARLNKEFAWAHTALGNALHEKGRLDEALAEYR